MEGGGTTSEAQPASFRCVQCVIPIKTLYIQYSPGNIRLMKCGNCKAVADEYIECEIMILIIDLILHKPKAYRHLFYNMFSKETLNLEGLLWKLILGFLILDAYGILVLSTYDKESSANVTSLLWGFRKMFAGVLFGNLAFLCVMFLGTRKFLNSPKGLYGYKDILLGVLVSSYFKIFLVATMVWEFPSSVIFIIDLFVISSNTVALEVITYSAMIRCLAVCIMAHSVKFLVSQGLSNYPLKLVI
ncbi:protein arv1 homolog isoform X2 [Olea europaea var. sylvestris]|uniref:protein arv1 homolog isoform X2 n=1 Tax=Olea europaea var. sylvestris TaxID=158386 RepID=UPI000C1CE7B2|nr:protein arv1 homolog isoform X2 [Olea europaea var. sylvestris]XP_022894890.1 protein arv1 homolog isoform X2 [Olea europaea var. sylvestris]